MTTPSSGAPPPIEIALVVPGLEEEGGVASVAEFVLRTIEGSGRYAARLVSLATSAHDACGVRLLRPSTWVRGVRTRTGVWRGRPFAHVGARLSELEFRRYRPRDAVAGAVSGCGVVQVVCGHPSWALAVTGLGVPVAVQCATRAVVERRRLARDARGWRGLLGRRMARITDRLDDRALEAVDCVQVENRWMLEHARALRGSRADDVVLAAPGVDVDVFRPAAAAAREDGRFLLTVGRLDDPRKNVGLLLDAYAELLRRTGSDVRLVLAGASGPAPALLERAASLGLSDRLEVRARPTREELVGLYRRATAFVVSSDEEGLGLALLEAMACGTPAIATRCGGPEEIVDDGTSGWLTPPDDVAEMARCLAACVSDPLERDRRGAAARDTVVRRFSADVAGGAFLATYDRLLARRAPRTVTAAGA